MNSSLSQLAESSNPWKSQDHAYAGLRMALALGEQTGHIANVN